MLNHHRSAWITCLVEGLIMVASGGIAGAADCRTAIDKAITEWIEKEPNWLDPEAAARPSDMAIGPYLRNADQRTRIALGRPIAKALARACGKSNVKALQERVENAPELILLALDDLEASETVAESVVELLRKDELKTAEGWPFSNQVVFDSQVFVWVSLCSPATRQATALASVKMPPVTSSNHMSPQFWFPAGTVFSFVAAVGDKSTLRALETAADEPEQVAWRPYYLEVASIIRKREALPPKVRDIRAKDDLLFWRANEDVVNYHLASKGLDQSAQTLVRQHERISTDYLLEKLGEAMEETSRASYESRHRLPASRRLGVGSTGLMLRILGKQRDPGAIPGLEEFAKKNPSFAAGVRKAIASIKDTGKKSQADEK